MKTLSLLRPVALIALPLSLLLANGCDDPTARVQSFPPPVDLKAVTEPKPRPTPDIVTDPQANERYNAEVESWGDGLLSAGRRICQWVIDNGGEVPFVCVREQPND